MLLLYILLVGEKMIFIDLSNKSKSFCEKIIDLISKNKIDIVINCNYHIYTKENIKIIKNYDEEKLIDYVKKSEMVLIFDINNYEKYFNYCNKIIMVLDSKNCKISTNINKLNMKFIKIDNINNIIKIKNKKSNIYLFFYFILITIILILSLMYINKDELINKLNKEKNILENEVVDLKQINKNYTSHLFLGDSITNYYNLEKYYDGYKVVNSGVCGDQTDDILKDLNSRAYIYNPSAIFLLVGTNDLEYEKSNEEIIENIKNIVKKLNKNLPNAKVYLESIYPINNTNDKKINKSLVGKRDNKRIVEINKELKKYCNNKNCVYIDIYNLLKDKNNNLKLEYAADGLHISNEGYEVITKELKKYMNVVK